MFESAKMRCILEILQILSKSKSKYSILFKKTKVSHTTLQSVLKYLENKRLVKKRNIGHKNVDYTITDKGKKFLEYLLKMDELLS